MIRRGKWPEGNFYVLDKAISEDRRLSWAARGLLIYLLGKPEHWQVSTANLINETAASGAPLGRDGVRALYGQLAAAGYLRKLGQRRDEAGKIGLADYEVSEVPFAVEGGATHCTGAPMQDKPATAKPATAKTPQASTEKKQVLTATKTDRCTRARTKKFDMDMDAPHYRPF